MIILFPFEYLFWSYFYPSLSSKSSKGLGVQQVPSKCLMWQQPLSARGLMRSLFHVSVRSTEEILQKLVIIITLSLSATCGGVKWHCEWPQPGDWCWVVDIFALYCTIMVSSLKVSSLDQIQLKRLTGPSRLRYKEKVSLLSIYTSGTLLFYVILFCHR